MATNHATEAVRVIVVLCLLFIPTCSRHVEHKAVERQQDAESSPRGSRPAVPDLTGRWVDPIVFSKERQRGRGGYYFWDFKVPRVTRTHTQTEDGIPLISSSHSGMFHIDPATRPMSIDIQLKTPLGKTLQYHGIIEVDENTLTLCLGDEVRPRTFAASDSTQLFKLQRISYD